MSEAAYHNGMDAILDLPLFDFRLSPSDVSAGLTFRPCPRLVDPDETETTFAP